ncbi:MAG: hypothetical protein ACE5IJ_03360, partial [Thermoplasmata archaeon]
MRLLDINIRLMTDSSGTSESERNSSILISDRSIRSEQEGRFHHSTLVAQLIKVIDSVQDHLNIGT